MNEQQLNLCKYVPPVARRVVEISGGTGVLKEISKRRSPHMAVEQVSSVEDFIPGPSDLVLLHHDAVPGLSEGRFEAVLSEINPGGQFIGPADPEPSWIRALLQETGFQIFQDREALRAVRQSEPVRRMLLHCSIPEEQAASSDIRIHYPNAFLRTIPGIRPFAQIGVLNFDVAREEEARILIFHRSVPTIDQDIKLLRRAVDEGYLLVYEVDDHPSYFSGHYADDDFALRCYHAVQSTNEELASTFRPNFGDDIGLFPNQLAFLPPPVEGREEGLRVFFGAFNRTPESRAIVRSINRVLPRLGDQVHFEVIHDEAFFAGLETGRKRFTPRCSYARYQDILGTSDIALLPLEDTEFNRCKSDLKFLECAGHGAAVICSPTVYGSEVADGETGLIANELSDFGALLERLVADPGLRTRLRQNAYAHVRDTRMLAQHYTGRADWYWSLWEQREDLREKLKRRAPELFI